MTPPIVVDASVAIKWYIPEEHSDRALWLRRYPGELLAPDLLVAELGNIVWKRVQRGHLTPREGQRIVIALVTACPVTILPSLPLLPAAFQLAQTYKRPVYDALYITLAGARDGRCITADATLVRALRRTPVGTSLWFLGDLRASELI